MKNTLRLIKFLILGMLIPFGCISQDSDKVPASVKENFKQKYPNENDPDWHLDRNDNFEANFKKDGIKYKADYSPNGQWIETENSIKKKDLPDAIKKALKADYKDYKIVEIEQVSHNKKGNFYDVELKKDGKKMDVEFNAEGQKIN